MIYIFDIDGTLTPSRLKMDDSFKRWFTEFVKRERVWLITGSDEEKTIEQIGYDLWESVERAYQCSGNVLYIDGELIETTKFELPSEYEERLRKILHLSTYPVRAGNHIEKRFGTVNFSIVGRNCTQEQRDEYGEWDNVNKERLAIVEGLNELFPKYEAVVGGQISIDIFERGRDKGQIVSQLKDEQFTFFGDHLKEGGNDYPVKREAIKLGLADNASFIEVDGWQDTFKHLSNITKTT